MTATTATTARNNDKWALSVQCEGCNVELYRAWAVPEANKTGIVRYMRKIIEKMCPSHLQCKGGFRINWRKM